MTPQFKLTLPGLLLLLLVTLAMLYGCGSTPSSPTAGPLIPPLPEQARQTRSGCSPKCSEELTTLRVDMRLKLTLTASPDSPASAPTTP